MAAQNSVDSSYPPRNQAVFLDSIDEILRAGRVKLAASSDKWANPTLVEADHFNYQDLGKSSEPKNDRFRYRNQSLHLQYSSLLSRSSIQDKNMRGKTLSFPKNRRLVLDICHAARSIPTFPVERIFQLGDLSKARDLAGVRISWAALYTRAYGLVCQAIPELRQLFVSYPTPRLYEHPHSVASISVHRDDPNGGKRLIWGRIDNAEQMGLVEIQQRLDWVICGPLNEVFKDGMRLERLPAPLRRLSWWLAMNWQGRQRAKKIGTFSISTLAGENVLNRNHPLVETSSLTYSRCDSNGSSIVTLLSDHRVLDGVLAAQALKLLESQLNGQVLEELFELRSSQKDPSSVRSISNQNAA